MGSPFCCIRIPQDGSGELTMDEINAAPQETQLHLKAGRDLRLEQTSPNFLLGVSSEALGLMSVFLPPFETGRPLKKESFTKRGSLNFLQNVAKRHPCWG